MKMIFTDKKHAINLRISECKDYKDRLFNSLEINIILQVRRGNAKIYLQNI
ncbi:hypothetical protein ES703_02208 [subsurface metagenome]